MYQKITKKRRKACTIARTRVSGDKNEKKRRNARTTARTCVPEVLAVKGGAGVWPVGRNEVLVA